MKKLMSFVCAALFAFSFCAVMPSNAFSADPNRQEVEKRFELNSATGSAQLAVNRLRSKMLTQAGREFIHLAQELFHD